MSPGMTHLPWASMTWALAGTGNDDEGPTARMRSPATRTVRSGSAAAAPSRPGWITVAPTMARVAEPLLTLDDDAPHAAARTETVRSACLMARELTPAREPLPIDKPAYSRRRGR